MGVLRVDRLCGEPFEVRCGDRVVVARCFRASGLLSRLVGLLGTPDLATDEGLWLGPCSSVHSFGMRVPLTVAFLDGDGSVLRVCDLPPWRVVVCRGARSVLEVRRGGLAGTAPTDRLIGAPTTKETRS